MYYMTTTCNDLKDIDLILLISTPNQSKQALHVDTPVVTQN